MITFEMAKRKVEKKNHKIVKSIELPDRFAFIVIPEDADLETFDCVGTYVYKNDGHIGYGIPTVKELEKAVEGYYDTYLGSDYSDGINHWKYNKLMETYKKKSLSGIAQTIINDGKDFVSRLFKKKK